MKACLMVVCLIAFAGALFAEPSYVGAAKCAKMCHKAKAKGEQYVVWQDSKHAKAYDDLTSPKALEAAKKAGVTDPQKSEKCLKCHVAGYGVAANLLDSTYSVKDGVSCEACHGPGSEYGKLKIMKDKKLAMAAGLTIPDEKVCVKCHNSESPFYKEFKFDEMSKKIAHAAPKK